MFSLARSILPGMVAKQVEISLSGSAGSSSCTCALEQRVALLESKIAALQTLLMCHDVEEEDEAKVETFPEADSASVESHGKSEEDENAKMQAVLVRVMAQGDPEEMATQMALALLAEEEVCLEKAKRRKGRQK